MKKQSSFKAKGLKDQRKALARKNNIIKGIQIATVGVVLVMVCASIYANVN
jgi:hypothetical protein